MLGKWDLLSSSPICHDFVKYARVVYAYVTTIPPFSTFWLPDVCNDELPRFPHIKFTSRIGLGVYLRYSFFSVILTFLLGQDSQTLCHSSIFQDVFVTILLLFSYGEANYWEEEGHTKKRGIPCHPMQGHKANIRVGQGVEGKCGQGPSLCFPQERPGNAG